MLQNTCLVVITTYYYYLLPKIDSIRPRKSPSQFDKILQGLFSRLRDHLQVHADDRHARERGELVLGGVAQGREERADEVSHVGKHPKHPLARLRLRIGDELRSHLWVLPHGSEEVLGALPRLAGPRDAPLLFLPLHQYGGPALKFETTQSSHITKMFICLCTAFLLQLLLRLLLLR